VTIFCEFALTFLDIFLMFTDHTLFICLLSMCYSCFVGFLSVCLYEYREVLNTFYFWHVFFIMSYCVYINDMAMTYLSYLILINITISNVL